MSKGVDYAFPPHPSIAALKAAGATFACRYLGGSVDKDLSRAEADALHVAGIATVSNWESTTGAARGGRSQGIADARSAVTQHAAAGGPPDRPIYFSVDWDVQPSELATVAAYFQGVASILGLARTGAYGGKRVITYLLDHGLITWAWQTYAWSGGQWDPRVHIRQIQNGVVIGGADTDLDQSMVADFGQWPFAGGGNVSTDDFIDSYRQGLTHAVDGKPVAPVDWEIRRQQRERNADTMQAQILSAVQALAARPAAAPVVDVQALATALAGQLPAVSEQQVLQALTSDAGQAALVQAANKAEDS